MDGNGSLFGTVSGNTREVLHKVSVDLPKKHGRGGQSALRFARLRLEKRHNYVRKVCGRGLARCQLCCGAWALSSSLHRLFVVHTECCLAWRLLASPFIRYLQGRETCVFVTLSDELRMTFPRIG